jgi:hypothetical protein
MFISNLILKLEEKERLENKNRGRSIHLWKRPKLIGNQEE